MRQFDTKRRTYTCSLIPTDCLKVGRESQLHLNETCGGTRRSCACCRRRDLVPGRRRTTRALLRRGGHTSMLSSQAHDASVRSLSRTVRLCIR